ncbi:hypothetical protein [Streptomyces sp. NPDC090025]|uniref:hypothetical protein n=1 Tax=Streptomyces sp. NPDC090025 TaxID=3365922 RepID=UPI0038328A76
MNTRNTRSTRSALDQSVELLAYGSSPVDAVDAVDARDPGVWIALERRIRDAVRYGDLARGRYGASPRGDDPLPGPVGEGHLVLALCDPYGRIREAALGAAADRPALYPLVAIRATDWVPAVRARALAVLAEALPRASAEALDRTAPVLLRLGGRLRGDAATALLDDLLATRPPATVRALLGHDDRPIRRLALDVCVRRGLLLYDRSGIVRACARWVLRQDGRDPVALYRAACADPATVPGWAPLGLAECGAAGGGLAVVRELTGHARPEVRTAAVVGLRVLADRDTGRLLALLDDPAPAVVREAARSLTALADRLPEAELVRRTGPEHAPHTRARALRLLRAVRAE